MVVRRVLITLYLLGILAYGQENNDQDEVFDINDYLSDPNSKQNVGQYISEGNPENATYIPDESKDLQLSCSSPLIIKDFIKWKRNGQEIPHIPYEEGNIFHAFYSVVNDEDALYECNGIKLWVLNKPTPRETFESSVWRGSDVNCIDPDDEFNADWGDDINIRSNGNYITKVSAKALRKVEGNVFSTQNPIYPIRKTKITADHTMSCNNTKKWSFLAQNLPTTELVYEGKKVICRSSDMLGKCVLEIFFGDESKAVGRSPEVSYEYKRINIQTTRCESKCTIDGTTEILPQEVKEINRGIFSAVIAIIIIIIIILIIIVLCCLWHRCGFKEKYGYKVNMRLNKSFNVDNKFSSYRLSGVEADGAEPESDDDEKAKDGEGSLIEDDSFVDPNFAQSNQDYNNKFDQSETQKPFLRI